MEIYYENHPVSAKRKAELVAKGYKVLDAKFKPKGYTNPGEPTKESTRGDSGRGRKRKQSAGE